MREYDPEFDIKMTIFIITVLFFGFIGGCMVGKAHASTYTLDQWADAIHKAENNDNYGIISIPCKGAQCRQYCKNTVHNTLIKYRKTRCKPWWGDLECLANRYCPINSNTDDGTCIHWPGNVKWFLENVE